MALSFKELTVRQRSVQMSVASYRVTSGFPREELYGLTAQIRRASISVASNIAEGWGRHTRRDFRNFLPMARGSNSELQTQLLIAAELGFGDRVLRERVLALSEEVGKMLVAFMRTLEEVQEAPQPAEQP
jgi:four helix bundle protein